MLSLQTFLSPPFFPRTLELEKKRWLPHNPATHTIRILMWQPLLYSGFWGLRLIRVPWINNVVCRWVIRESWVSAEQVSAPWVPPVLLPKLWWHWLRDARWLAGPCLICCVLMHVLIVVVALACVPAPRLVRVLLLQSVGQKELIAPCTLHPDIPSVSLLYLVAPLAVPHFRYALVPCTIRASSECR